MDPRPDTGSFIDPDSGQSADGAATAAERRAETAVPVKAGLHEAWAEWVRRTMRLDALGSARAVDAAVATVLAGGSTEVAVVASFVAGGLRPPPVALQALHAECWRLGELRAEAWRMVHALDGAEVHSDRAVVEALVGRLQHRLDVAGEMAARGAGGIGMAGGTPAASWMAGGGIPAGGGASTPPPTARPGNPTGREARSPQVAGVRVLGATGVLLLITSTLLFELFAVARHALLARFGVAVLLEGVLVAVAVACGRSQRFRPVFAVYLAASALVLPVVIGAGMAVVSVGYAVDPVVGLAIGGTICALVYGALAISLPSRVYGALSLAAGGTAWLAGMATMWKAVGQAGPTAIVDTSSAARGEQLSLSLALLAGLYLIVDAVALDKAGRGDRNPRRLAASRVFTGSALVFSVLAGTLAAVGATVSAGGLPAGSPAASLVLAVLAVELLLAGRQVTRRACLPVAAALGMVALLMLATAMGWGRSETAVVLAVLGYAVLAIEFGAATIHVGRRTFRTTPRGDSPTAWLWSLATVDALAVAVALPHRLVWWAPALLVAAAAVPMWIARRSAHLNWIWGSVPLAVAAWFSVAWSIGAAAGLVRPQAPGALAAAAMMSPLPVLLAGFALAVRGRRHDWSILAYSIAAAVAVLTVLLTVGARDVTWVAVELLGLWLAAEVVGQTEKWPWLSTVGTALGAVGAGVLVAGMDLGPDVAALASLGVLLAVFGAGLVVPPGASHPARSAMGAARRRAALWGIAGLVVWSLARMGALAGRPADHAAAFTALVSILVLTALLLAEGNRESNPWWSGRMPMFVGSLAGVPIAVLAGAVDPQWYVVAPGLAFVVVGVQLPSEPRIANAVVRGRWLSFIGFGVLLGTAVVQVVAADGGASTSIVLLVVEGMLAVLCGVILRRRVPAISGSAAVALGGLAALSLVPSTLALSVILGVVALVALAVSTVMLAGRGRPTGGMWAELGSGWSRWY